MIIFIGIMSIWIWRRDGEVNGFMTAKLLYEAYR
jgi:hypothetical protein